MFKSSSRNSRMDSVVLFISTLTCCLLLNKQWATASALQKPDIILVTQHPQNIIVKGDTITLKCMKGSGEAKEFQLVHEKGDGNDKTYNSISGEFLIENIQPQHDGDYSCKYCDLNNCSELSSPRNIYVRSTFSQPDIIVSPRRVVQPGASITITCRTFYADVEFSLLRNGVIVTNSSSDGKQFSYLMSNVKQSDIGSYQCMYGSKSRGIQSWRSNSMKILVLALPAPSMTWEEDPTDSSMLRINCTCTAPNHTYKQIVFKLLDGNEVIENDNAEIEHSVVFSIIKPKYSMKRFQCMYQIRLDSDEADSLYSIAEIGWSGFYTLMFIRHIISALILILLGVILLQHFSHKDEKPDLPPARVRYRKGTEDTDVKC